VEVFLVLEPYFLVLEISFLVEVSENMVQVRIFFKILEKKSKKALVEFWWKSVDFWCPNSFAQTIVGV